MSDDLRPLRLTDVLTVLWQRRLLIAALSVVGLCVGLGAAHLVPRSVTGTALVVVRPLLAAPQQGVVEPVMPTEAALVASERVARQAARRLAVHDGAVTTAGVQDAVVANPRTDSAVLEIGFRADTARHARAGADAVADAYLDLRRNDARDAAAGLIRRIQARIDELPASSTGSTAAQITELSRRLADVAAADPDPGEIVSPARSSPVGSPPGVVPWGLGGLLLGALTGAAFTLLAAGAPCDARRSA